MDTNQQQQQQQQQLIEQQSQRTCYVCTTMDYENPANNYCRFMKRMIQKQHQQHASSSPLSSNYDLNNVQSQYNALRLRNQHLHANQDTSSQNQISSQHLVNGQNNNSTTNNNLVQYNNQFADANLFMNNSTSTQKFSENGYSLIESTQYNGIRTRYCYSDENFCSVVSVVRIEYINNELQSRFWALER